jgi:hypothetical protein
MAGSFSYSFDRETFHGNFPTRQEALQQAIEKLHDWDNSAQVIYIGKRLPFDPASSGIGEMVLGAIRRRVRDEIGDGASQPLRRVDEHQLAELDEKLNQVIRSWMSQHDLLPTLTKITSISEHPVPSAATSHE